MKLTASVVREEYFISLINNKQRKSTKTVPLTKITLRHTNCMKLMETKLFKIKLRKSKKEISDERDFLIQCQLTISRFVKTVSRFLIEKIAVKLDCSRPSRKTKNSGRYTQGMSSRSGEIQNERNRFFLWGLLPYDFCCNRRSIWNISLFNFFDIQTTSSIHFQQNRRNVQ